MNSRCVTPRFSLLDLAQHIRSHLNGIDRRYVSRACLFTTDRGGAAAVEFALIVPLLLSMYFVTVEIGQGIETSKKVGRVASAIGDLVAQESSVTKSQLEAIVKIGAAIIQPYARSTPDIVITGIQLSDQATPVAKVVWRYTVLGGKTPVSETPASEITTVPPTLRLRNAFLVRVYTELAYKPIITWSPRSTKGDSRNYRRRSTARRWMKPTISVGA